MLATALLVTGEPQAALELAEQALRDQPASPEARIARAQIRQRGGDLPGALADAEQAVAARPWWTGAWLLVAVLRRALGDAPGVMAALEQVLQRAPEHVDALVSLGEYRRQAGETEGALALLGRAVALAPANADAWSNYGAALQQAERTEEAREACQRALTLNPNHPQALNNLGVLLRKAGRWEEALEVLEQALRLQPTDLMLRGNYCYALETANRIDDLRTALGDTRAVAGEELSLALAWARLLRRDEQAGAALALLRAAAPQADQDAGLGAELQALLGDLEHAEGQYQEAFASYAACNRLAEGLYDAQGVDRGSYGALAQRLLSAFTPAWVADWTADADPEAGAELAFLIGFPRSGTTLLDSILRSHPAVAVLEEQPMSDRVWQALEAHPAGYPGALAGLDAAAVEQLRGLYRQELARYLAPAERARALIVDKLPLNVLHVGMLQRLFPAARFILALRHPCDGVLSCFMRHFAPNAAMANFLTLEGAAGFYDQCMRVWVRYRELLPLKVHELRYEDLVADFDTEVRGLLEFLQLPWDEAVKGYADTARARGQISTPSYHQVVQPIYRHAAGRWEKYREQMAPVLPVLAPWVQRWGYAPIGEDGLTSASEARR